MSENYKKAGVDIHAGYEAVSRIKKHVERTKTPGVMGGIGGFGGMFDLSHPAFSRYKEPVLVSGTDGVGTKLMLAFQMNKHDTIGIDAVAMSVNDIITVGAEPLFFLDYIACGKLNPAVMEDIVKGISDGCVQSGCALIGGEMAEHPDMMPDDEYDIAGFCVGIAEKQKMLAVSQVTAGDALIGIASSGMHSNGFSLVRKIISDKKLNLQQTYSGFSAALGEVLLTPTRIYTAAIARLFEAELPKGVSNITGGGFQENVPRILPAGLGAEICRTAWEVPQVFKFLQEQGGLSDEEMFNTYNMGIGMVVAVSEENVAQAMKILEAAGEKAVKIGRVVAGDGVVFTR